MVHPIWKILNPKLDVESLLSFSYVMLKDRLPGKFHPKLQTVIYNEDYWLAAVDYEDNTLSINRLNSKWFICIEVGILTYRKYNKETETAGVVQ